MKSLEKFNPLIHNNRISGDTFSENRRLTEPSLFAKITKIITKINNLIIDSRISDKLFSSNSRITAH